jgi:hypothetical protein
MWRKQCAYHHQGAIVTPCLHQSNPRRRIISGVALILIGSAFLLDRAGVVDVDHFWHCWPILIALVGLTNIVAPARSSQVSLGFFQIFLACWLYICSEHLWGWTFQNAWPILLIGVGLGMIVRSLICINSKD